jgi:hypothetical protein
MLMVPLKKCAKCGVEQPLTNYHAHPKLKYHPRCKPCRAEAQREYYVANPEKFKAYKARARNETVEERDARIQRRKDEAPSKRKLAGWKWHIRKTLGVTAEQYEQMYETQSGKCAICGTTDPGGKRTRFSIDHCHDTGAIRGLLCVSCNSGLGYFKDDISRLEGAVAYLKGHK